MEKIQFIGVITPEQLQKQISNGVKEQLTELLKVNPKKQPNEQLTQQDGAIIFNVNIYILHERVQSSRLKPQRVDFLRSVIEKSLISTIKYLVLHLVLKFLCNQLFTHPLFLCFIQ